MTFSFRDVEWRVTVPDIPDELPVATVATPSYEERLHAVRTLHDRFGLTGTVELDLPHGVAHASRQGEVQYFAASGGVRARNAELGGSFADERRNWGDVEKVEGRDGITFELGEKTTSTLLVDAHELLRTAKLLPDGLDDFGVVLDQWALLDESGEELERGPGRAVVRASYAMDGLPFIGAGAKTRLQYEPVDGRPALARLFHVHRPVIETRAVRTGGTEQALTGLLRDPFLIEHHERGAHVAVTGIQVGLLALPAVVPQRVAAPALAVEGVVEKVKDARHGEVALRFARFYQAVSAKALRGIGLAAAHVAR
jgi:hypothetical protein